MAGKLILVTGADGQLGNDLRRLEIKPDVRFVFATSAELDITNKEIVSDFFSKETFTHCINCAAYTNVEKAEEEAEKAFRINAEAAGSLAEICREHSVFLIHISTDFVFDGMQKQPYKPGDATNPLSVYGNSKLKGEQLVLEKNPRTVIIRTSWLYNHTGKNFVNTILARLSSKEPVKVVNDQYGCPTYAGDLANAILQIIQNSVFVPGIFHYCNEGVISWYEFAAAIKDISGFDKDIVPVNSSEFPVKAKRPAYSALDCNRINHEYNIQQKPWRESLEKCLSLKK